ncbi:MAG: hypothetical protein ABL984_06940 [Pyrinomonadaceae bacterium]
MSVLIGDTEMSTDAKNEIRRRAEARRKVSSPIMCRGCGRGIVPRLGVLCSDCIVVECNRSAYRTEQEKAERIVLWTVIIVFGMLVAMAYLYFSMESKNRLSKIEAGANVTHTNESRSLPERTRLLKMNFPASRMRPKEAASLRDQD